MTEELNATFDQLATVIPFDAVQLLRFRGHRPPGELYRRGFSANTAWALAHMFPRKYPMGFTGGTELPRTLSTSEYAGEFTQSALYREHLGQEGYADVMSLELYHGGDPIGMAHFASTRHDAFCGEPRRFGRAISGLLGQLVSSVPEPGRPTETTPGPDPFLLEQLAADPAFQRHLEIFRCSSLALVEHLWWVGRKPVVATVRQVDKFTARPATPADIQRLTRQELQVLSVLCCGASDADIAERLVVSPRTVQSHINKLRQKLGAASRLEAVVIALGQKIYVPHPDWAPISQIVRGRPTHSSSPARH